MGSLQTFMQQRSLSCQRGWRSGGSNLSIDTETICILILFQCARIHNNTSQLFKCACIEKSAERSTTPAAGKERCFCGTDNSWLETKTPAAAKDVYLNQDFLTGEVLKKIWKLREEEGGGWRRGGRKARGCERIRLLLLQVVCWS